MSSDQQPTSSTTVSAVRTAITLLSDKELQQFEYVIKTCGLSLLGPIGSLAGIADTLRDGTDREHLTKAAQLGEETSINTALDLSASRAGFRGVPLAPFDVGKCVLALKAGQFIE